MNPDELAKRLGGRLRDLRKAARLSQEALAKRLGVTQSKVTKNETGATAPPTSEDVVAWVAATGGSDEERIDLLALWAEHQAVSHEWSTKFSKGQSLTQGEYDRMARNSTLVRNFETAAVPGLLQIYDYAHHRTLEGQRQNASPDLGEIEKNTRARIKRGEVLFEPGRRFEFLIAEPVLSWHLAPYATLRAQFSRIIALSDLPNVSVSVLPFDADLRDTPQHGFILFDDTAVVETLAREEKFPGQDKARKYLDLFTDFWALALHDDAARQKIESAIRRLPQ